MTSKPKTYSMWHPGKTADGRHTFVEHALPHANNREEAKVIAMGTVRTLEIEEMHLIENPGELLFYAWPLKRE